MQGLLASFDMTRASASTAGAESPEVLLRKATLARSAAARAKYARRGLQSPGRLDSTTRTMLLRQLYLSHMEGRRFAEALAVAKKMVDLRVMPDVARQDAARACLAFGVGRRVRRPGCAFAAGDRPGGRAPRSGVGSIEAVAFNLGRRLETIPLFE